MEIFPVGDRCPPALDRPAQHLRHCPDYFTPFAEGETGRFPQRAYPGTEKDLACIDVSDARNHILIHEKILHGEPAPPCDLENPPAIEAVQGLAPPGEPVIPAGTPEGRQPPQVGQKQAPVGKSKKKTGPRRSDTRLLPVKPAGHSKLEKKRKASLELKLEGFAPAKDGENSLPCGVLHFPQAIIEDPALPYPGPEDNLPELTAQGFHFGQFGHAIVLQGREGAGPSIWLNGRQLTGLSP